MFLIPLVALLGGVIWLATAKAVNTTQTAQPVVPPLGPPPQPIPIFPPAQPPQPILSDADQANANSMGLTAQEYVNGGLGTPIGYLGGEA